VRYLSWGGPAGLRALQKREFRKTDKGDGRKGIQKIGLNQKQQAGENDGQINLNVA